MGYEELFPPYNMEWHGRATKRFANPFVGEKFERIDVDPIMLSHAAVACGYTIRDFYEKPELGYSCLVYMYQLYDLLPVGHWFYASPWLAELGCKMVQKDTLPPIPDSTPVETLEDVDKLEVPSEEDLRKGTTYPQYQRLYEYVQKNYPHTFVPISYGFDPVGEAAALCGVENFIMWTFTEQDAAHKLLDKFTQTAINGAYCTAKDYGSAMLVVASVLANNDIFSDEAIREFSVKYMRQYIDKSFRGGAGPQIFYHCCGNQETSYKEFHNLIWSPFTVIHFGYKGKDVFPSELLVKEFGNRATCMGTVDTKLLINPNPKAVYDQASKQVIAGRDAPRGFILGAACECPPYTLPANILAMTQAATDHGTYGKW
jgi:uroporphyrinogen decarboxylase